MARDGKPTRDRILSESKSLIYENGFAGTSIDLILQRTKITKGAFFYHFKTKSDLALTLMEEFVKSDLGELDRVLQETLKYRDDPRTRLLQFLQYFIDSFSGLEEPPSCLYASVINEQNQYKEELKLMVKDTMFRWRQAIVEMIDQTTKEHPPMMEVDNEALADHFTVVIEGAFIMSKAINDTSVTSKQLIHLKNYFELLFPEVV